MYKAVIFDLDGTLLNTIHDICDSLNDALQKSQLPCVSVETCQYMVGQGVDVLITKAVSNPTARAAVMSHYLAHYEENQFHHTKPYDGIVEVLHLLQSLGMKLAVLSNKPHVDTVRIVEHYFGNELFDVVMGQKPTNRPKPSLDGCYEILSLLNITHDILYVGDTAVDMETAKRAGFDSVAVTWGFRKPEEIIPHHFIINHPRELLPIVRQSR
ncbi:MAG: HAD family hydrolase [Bacilli bacterium]